MSTPHEPLSGDFVLRRTLHRRTLFVGALASVCAAAVTTSQPAVAASAGPSTTAYAATAWRQLVGRVLTAPGGGVRLTSVSEQQSGPFESFQLRFVTLGGRPMPEQLVVRHPRHGRVTFLVTPTGATGIAVVNRRRS